MPDPVADATLWGADHLEVVFVRHGQPLPPGERAGPERDDPPLTTLGHRQAEAAAAALAGDMVDAVYSSDLARARQTAADLATVTGHRVRIVPALREIGLPDTGSRPAGLSVRAWERAGRRFVRHGRWDAFPGAEPRRAFRHRVRQALATVTARHRDDRRVVIVCHNGVLNAALADTLHTRRDYLTRPAHASLTRIHYTPHHRALWTLNETAHLTLDLLTG
ncbi:histidine phosphatase family protein [Catenuloplanes indicus]|uniref:Broad specificity phosphatase PhoE n=1 Tax=Catenuloplanes indicus TaxID=137267 RepID=A0AAE3VVJ8_9ACTN|nr:histidine phosphatase family protein [Catenuloplanes indicus]MDQ0364445.1 broad specificity phosphatase PhoE [Catenuloplanes indicus]